MNKIIILGSYEDPHVQRVSDKLKESGFSYHIVDFLKSVRYQFVSDRSAGWKFLVDDEFEITHTDIIWDRVKFIYGSILFPKGERREAVFKSNEWRAFYSLIKSLYSKKVMNTLSCRHFQLKPYQQLITAEVGFNVPSTVVTTSKIDALSFVKANGSCITKSLSAAKVIPKDSENPIPYNIMTMEVTEADLNVSSSEEFSETPLLIQENISKKHELRVVVVSDKVFAFNINSQDYKYSQVDWRYGNLDLKFTKVELPSKINNQLILYLKKQNMFSGSFDLIVDDNDDYWFLECNQDGQWAWLDDIVDNQISTVFAEKLADLAI